MSAAQTSGKESGKRIVPLGEPIKQPHGGALRNILPGQVMNPGGIPERYHELKRALQRWCCTEGIDKLIEFTRSDDERIALMATMGIFDRAWGKPRERKAEEDAASDLPRADLSRLSDTDRRQLMDLLRKMVGVVDGKAE